MIFVLAAALLGIAAPGSPLSTGEPGTPGRAPAPVGSLTRRFSDENRRNWEGTGARPLKTLLWFPAAEPGAAVPSPEPRKYPLILLSHGSNGRAADMQWLGQKLAEQGYIAAAVAHTEEDRRTAGDWPLSEFEVWERPRDLTVVLDELLADPLLGNRIDRKRIAAAGFSLGGSTVISLAGARLDMKELAAKSPPPPIPELRKGIAGYMELLQTRPDLRARRTHSGDSYRDRRIRGVFALAPAIGAGFTPAGLAPVTVPVEVVVGQDDLITPPDPNARHYADHIRGARLTVLPGEAGHFIRNTDEASRAEILDRVSGLAVAFFDRLFAGN